MSLLEHFPFLQTQYGIINDQNGAPVKGVVVEICFFKDLEVKISKKVIKYILKIRPFSDIPRACNVSDKSLGPSAFSVCRKSAWNWAQKIGMPEIKMLFQPLKLKISKKVIK